MAIPTDFEGSNTWFGPNERGEGGTIGFGNGKQSVTCWKFTAEELDEIKRTGQVFLAIQLDGKMAPSYVGTETTVKELIATNGCAVWSE